MFEEKLQLPSSGIMYLLGIGNTYIDLELDGEWEVKPGSARNRVAGGGLFNRRKIIARSV
jgi:hypothetical protein